MTLCQITTPSRVFNLAFNSRGSAFNWLQRNSCKQDCDGTWWKDNNRVNVQIVDNFTTAEDTTEAEHYLLNL